MSKYDLHQMPIIYQAELKQETESVLQKGKATWSPAHSRK